MRVCALWFCMVLEKCRRRFVCEGSLYGRFVWELFGEREEREICMGESAGGLLLWELSGQLIVWVSGRQSLELSKLGWAGLAWGGGSGSVWSAARGGGCAYGKGRWTEDWASFFLAWSVWVRGGAPLPGVPGLWLCLLASSLASRLVRSLFGSPSCLSINCCWTFLWVCAYHFSHPSALHFLCLGAFFPSFLACCSQTVLSLDRLVAYFLVFGPPPPPPLTPTYRICCFLVFVLQHLN